MTLQPLGLQKSVPNSAQAEWAKFIAPQKLDRDVAIKVLPADFRANIHGSSASSERLKPPKYPLSL